MNTEFDPPKGAIAVQPVVKNKINDDAGKVADQKETMSKHNAGSKDVDNTSAVIARLDDISLDVSVDQATNEAVIHLRSKSTGEILFTIPAEESRNIQKTIQAIKGSIFSQKV